MRRPVVRTTPQIPRQCHRRLAERFAYPRITGLRGALKCCGVGRIKMRGLTNEAGRTRKAYRHACSSGLVRQSPRRSAARPDAAALDPTRSFVSPCLRGSVALRASVPRDLYASPGNRLRLRQPHALELEARVDDQPDLVERAHDGGTYSLTFVRAEGGEHAVHFRSAATQAKRE